MRNRSKLLLMGLTAAMLLSIGVGSASANRLSTNATAQRIVWTPLTFASTGGSVIRCNVTLEQRFHSATIAKVRGSLIGFITAANVAACSGGAVTVLTATLPWHVRYNSFTGTLPSLTGVNFDLIGTAFRIQPTGSIACLARSTVENPARGTAVISGGRVTGLRADPTATIPLEGFFCAFGGEGTFSGTGTVSRSGTTVQDITVRLI